MWLPNMKRDVLVLHSRYVLMFSNITLIVGHSSSVFCLIVIIIMMTMMIMTMIRYDIACAI